MEFIWKQGVGFKIAIASRFALVITSLTVALQAPDHLPRWLSIFRAVLAGWY